MSPACTQPDGCPFGHPNQIADPKYAPGGSVYEGRLFPPRSKQYETPNSPPYKRTQPQAEEELLLAGAATSTRTGRSSRPPVGLRPRLNSHQEHSPTSETKNAGTCVWMRNMAELVIGDICIQLIIVRRPILFWEPDHKIDFAAVGVACCIPGQISYVDTLFLATYDQ